MQMQMNNEKDQLLHKISALGLAAYDAKLYLYTNDCPDARDYFYSKAAEYHEAIALFDEKYGNITFKTHPSEDMMWAWQIDHTFGRC